jgi:YHS domain-containing protein
MQKILLAVFTLMLTGMAAYGQQPPIFQTEGKAINGYDVVAYYNEGKPIPGHDSLSFQWSNSRWLFSSTANLELFRQNPEQYAPQYGGYCAYGTASGYKAPTQPDAWAIVNGKLYFNYNKKVKAGWDKDQAGYIHKADANWLLIKDK